VPALALAENRLTADVIQGAIQKKLPSIFTQAETMRVVRVCVGVAKISKIHTRCDFLGVRCDQCMDKRCEVVMSGGGHT
jgi:hypothetical protein